jgi:cell division GTPase FtsZ
MDYKEYMRGASKLPKPEEKGMEEQDLPQEAEESSIIETPIEDLGIDLPDIPLPPEGTERKVIEDKFKGAYRFAIIGIGQGGSRIAETFWNLGYRRVVVINTAKQDLVNIQVPDENKLLVGGDGAGKNPDRAEKVFADNYEDILDFLRKALPGGFDRAIITAGAGGGTGAGGTAVMIDILHDLCESLGVERTMSDAKIGAILALPTRAEGEKVQENAKRTVSKVVEKMEAGHMSPLMLCDNERIKQIYPGLSISKFWQTANSSIVSLLHLFNRVSAQDSAYTSFDKEDLETILSSGVITFGAVQLKPDMVAEDEISKAIRINLRRNILAGVDISTGNIASCVLVGDKESLDNISQESIEHGFEQLSRLLKEGSTVHRGIYNSKKPGLVIYTIIGGLQIPKDLFEIFFKSERKYKF